jgi:hypothetical protein
LILPPTYKAIGGVENSDTRGIAVEHPNAGVAGKNFMDHGFVRDMIRQNTPGTYTYAGWCERGRP